MISKFALEAACRLGQTTIGTFETADYLCIVYVIIELLAIGPLYPFYRPSPNLFPYYLSLLLISFSPTVLFTSQASRAPLDLAARLSGFGTYTRPLERVSPLRTAPTPSKTTTMKAKVIKIQVIQAKASAATSWLQWMRPLVEQFRPSRAAE